MKAKFSKDGNVISIRGHGKVKIGRKCLSWDYRVSNDKVQGNRIWIHNNKGGLVETLKVPAIRRLASKSSEQIEEIIFEIIEKEYCQ